MFKLAWTADFETTTNQDDCRVWAFGLCQINNSDLFIYGNSIDDFMLWCEQSKNETLYFHNLKFDGEFIINWLFHHGFKHITDKKKAHNKTFTTLISDQGQFYTMTIYFYVGEDETRKVTIYDSLKIIPFTVEKVAKAFGLPISKLEIDYQEYREPGHKLSKIEIDYLRNDVTIMAKALEIMFEQNLTKMTQGSNALHDYKNIVTPKKFKKWFPIPTYDHDIRQSYKGGWTYVNPKIAGKDIGEGIVLDVNSLYPSVMYYRPLPFGEGVYFKGKYTPDSTYNLYIQMFSCQFEIKRDYLPTIQLKNNLSFLATEYITSSKNEEITLCLTSVDLELFFAHYDVYNIEWLSGWKFKSTTGLFQEYIDKWNGIKMQSTIDGNEGMRTLAKLMLNSLYGKFALNPNVQSKIPYLDSETDVVKYRLGEKETRDPIYIPVGTFITAWARYTTISAAQKVYDRFLYADTDSLHLVGTNLPTELEIDRVALGKWKHESTFTRARFIRQKSYIEEINGVLHITCAGMPSRCYPYVTWDNFKEGSSFAGKLQQTHVPGGIVFKDIDFTIKK